MPSAPVASEPVRSSQQLLGSQPCRLKGTEIESQSNTLFSKYCVLIGCFFLRTLFVVLDMDTRTPRGLYISELLKSAGNSNFERKSKQISAIEIRKSFRFVKMKLENEIESQVTNRKLRSETMCKEPLTENSKTYPTTANKKNCEISANTDQSAHQFCDLTSFSFICGICRTEHNLW